MNNARVTRKGRLEVICGSMFSGKTEELMRRLKRAEYAKQQVFAIKHQLDKSRSGTFIMSHEGRQRDALPLDGHNGSLELIAQLSHQAIDVVGIDEVQFFPEDIIEIICKLIESGKRVIVAGLDLDFRGHPFGNMPTLLSLADEVLKLKAICVACGKDAHHTQRIINGAPARYDDPLILIGAQDCYEARCRDCFNIDKHAFIKQPRLASSL